jgi:hypothetical protein
MVATQISESQTLECQPLPVVDRADLLENELFNAVACLEPSPAEFSHSLYQLLQVECFFRILTLILDQWWKKMLVRPIRRVAQVDVEPPSRGAFPAAPEGNL